MVRTWLARLQRALLGTLRRQLVLSVAGVHALMMAGIVWDLTSHQEQMLVTRLSEQAQALAQALATSLAAEVVSRDLAGLQQVMQAHRRNPELAFAMVATPDGNVLAHSDPGHVQQWITDLPAAPVAQLLVASIHLADAVAPVVVAGVPRGWVRVGLSGASAQQRLERIVAEGIAYTAAAVLIGVTLAWALARRMTRRLQAIQEVADAVQHGQSQRRAPVGGTDEAAVLAASFNHMLDRLEKAKVAEGASGMRLKLALDAAAMAAWRWKVGAEHTDWLEGREHLLGARPPDGYPDFREMVLAEDREAFLDAGRQALSPGSQGYGSEFRLRRTDGSVRWMRAVGSVERDEQGHPVAITGVTQDVTERRLVEERLRESEARASRIIESSADALLIIDRQGQVVQANRRAVEMFGHPLAALVGRSVEHLVPEAKRGAHAQRRHEFMARPDHGQRWYRTRAMTGLHADGTDFPIQVTLAAIGDGEEQHIIATVHDESEDQALRDELVHHREHLEDLVARRTAELTAARNEAQRLAQAKSEFLARMSHEIRTPLNGVLGLAQLGRTQVVDADARSRFERIEQAGRHLLGVVNDILDFSRLDAGKLAVAQEVFDLPAIVASAVDLVTHEALARRLGFVVTLAPDLPRLVVGDGQRLRQVLVNLLANALKFTPEGEVRMRVAAEGGAIYFKVIDTGIGMSAEQVERLFEPFEQGDSSTTRRFGGSGLGLAISLRLTRLMGGTIAVESAPGSGSAFTLRLPLRVAAAVPAATPAPRSTLQANRLRGLRLLVAEDVEVNRIVIEGMLRHEGADVVLVGDGQQVLDCLASSEQPFDAVLMDVQMPVMDGLVAARHVARLDPGLPVIAMTAHALEEDLQQCFAAGMVATLTKPLEMDQVAATLQRFVPVPARAAG